MSRRDDRVYLLHVLDSAERVRRYLDGLDEEAFERSLIHQDAVIRQLGVIGEAVKRLSEGFRADHPGVPWRDIAGMRDKLVHDYMGVDLQAVWETAMGDLPALARDVRAILDTERA
jgi:uncharacterized protein with HEPN domain